MKIHDPNLDAMFRNGQPPQQNVGLTVAEPMKVDAILAFIASEQMAAHLAWDAKKAVEVACDIFAEASVALVTNRLHQLVTAKVQLAHAAADPAQ